MHNNFYFLRQLTERLDAKLKGAVVSECFSQSKDELILRFEIGAGSFYIRANLAPELSCLSFAGSFQRARKNSVDLFPQIIGQRVTGTRQFSNERSFALNLSDDQHVLFKMHANRSNAVIFENGNATDVFRNNLPADQNLQLNGLDRNIDRSRQAFMEHIQNPRSLYFTFGKVVWRYLEEHGFSSKTDEEKWQAIQDVFAILEKPSYYITLIDGKPVLSLVETGEIRKRYDDPVDAANEFFYFFTHVYAFSKEKSRLLNYLNSRLAAGKNYCAKNSEKLDEVLQDNHYKIWADLLMANLHTIKPGTEKVLLPNFYETDKTEEIKLKKDLTPQKNAELFYKKGKNQHIEIDRLERSIRQKEEEIEVVRKQIARLSEVNDLKTLRALEGDIGPEPVANEKVTLPYHQFDFRNFRILVGKNAVANDLLTLKFSHKEDLWLHAKDVSGSHVLIKHQSGKSFPRDVIEYAASLAAYNSKRKNESLCPVIVTPKKFVRKRKGDPPGAVVVEREEVVMVEPLNPTDL